MFKKSSKMLLKILLIALSISFPAQARWADYEDADIEKEFYNEDILIHENGTMERVVEVQEKILKEAGRQYAAHYVEYYNGDSSKLSILDAKTIFRGKEYKLTKDLIEDKPLASAYQGFDQQRQILLAYPKAEIGASIYRKYKMSITKVLLDHVFTEIFQFGVGEYWQNSKIRLRSKIPLHLIVNDPDHVLKVTKDKDDNFYYMEINLEKPIYKALTNEPANVIIDKKKLTWVSVSSLTKWEDLAIKFSKDYQAIMNQPLPNVLQEIMDSALEIKNEEEQIHKIISSINDKIQYMSDARTIKGRYIPQSLNKVAITQMGDCKDFATIVAAILNRLNFKAEVALVLRGMYDVSYENILPTIDNFNHAIVKVTNKNGKVYWLDPTNPVSQVGGIFPDIANKMSLVLDEKHPSYERIPNIDSGHAQTIIDKELKMSKSGTVLDTGKIIFKGENAIYLTVAALYKSEKFIKDFIFYRLSNDYLEEQDKTKMILPKFTRIVQDFAVNYSYKQANKTISTNHGPALMQKYYWLNDIIDVADDQVSDLFINVPHTLKNRTIIKDAIVRKIENLNFSITSPWINVERICNTHANGAEIVDTIVFHKSIITNEELKSPAYKILQSALKEKFRAAIIFETQ